MSTCGTKLKETTIKRTEASKSSEETRWCHCEGILSWSSREDLEKWGKECYTFPQQGQKGSSEDLQEVQLCFGSREDSGRNHLGNHFQVHRIRMWEQQSSSFIYLVAFSNKMARYVDDERAVDIVYLKFIKTFDSLTHHPCI